MSDTLNGTGTAALEPRRRPASGVTRRELFQMGNALALPILFAGRLGRGLPTRRGRPPVR